MASLRCDIFSERLVCECHPSSLAGSGHMGKASVVEFFLGRHHSHVSSAGFYLAETGKDGPFLSEKKQVDPGPHFKNKESKNNKENNLPRIRSFFLRAPVRLLNTDSA